MVCARMENGHDDYNVEYVLQLAEMHINECLSLLDTK